MFTLPDLPYAYDALEPYIHADLQNLHHAKHHRAYVDALNKILMDYPDWQNKNVAEVVRSLNILPEVVRTGVRNYGGGHLNHSMFWEVMAPARGQQPSGTLLDKIKDNFGDLGVFKTQFSDGATKLFGSGWQWLVYADGKLRLEQTQNQDSPLTAGRIPLLTLDVWEHAYYLQYYNKRADYIAAWWNVVNWDNVAERLDRAMRT